MALSLGAGLLLHGDQPAWAVAGATLGVPLALLTATGLLDRRGAQRLPRAHCFEHGMVLATGAELAAHSWQRLRPFEWVTGGYRQTPVHHLQLRTLDGQPLFEFGGEVGWAAELVAADELPRSLQLLDQGSPVNFGRVTLTPEGMVVDGTAVPWPTIRRISSHRDRIDILHLTARGELRATIPCQDTPHQRVLLTLARSHMPE
ncbi:DUF6585 family protein [Kitasatospora sp. GP82]|uniref:DUF6585 family protein n=1 Tax=Kitasatospora sp. GP82 TaxID=3035089 RepID=UPI0024771F00|nr:DUF6585 family protein [Kitasatospora sp. GP82]